MDMSLKLIRSAATQFCGGRKITKKFALCLPIATIKAQEQRGLIRPGKGRDPLTIARRPKKKQP
jgi:hypothetical protein